jgi:hypothetical protein
VVDDVLPFSGEIRGKRPVRADRLCLGRGARADDGAGALGQDPADRERRHRQAGLTRQRLQVPAQPRQVQSARVSEPFAAAEVTRLERRQLEPVGQEPRCQRRASAEYATASRADGTEELGPVLHEDGDVVAGAQAAGAEQLCDLVGLPVQLGEGRLVAVLAGRARSGA